jgi:hypothetical protein
MEREMSSTFDTIFDDYNQKWIIRYFTPDVADVDGTSGIEWDDQVTFKSHDDAHAHGSAVVSSGNVQFLASMAPIGWTRS